MIVTVHSAGHQLRGIPNLRQRPGNNEVDNAPRDCLAPVPKTVPWCIVNVAISKPRAQRRLNGDFSLVVIRKLQIINFRSHQLGGYDILATGHQKIAFTLFYLNFNSFQELGLTHGHRTVIQCVHKSNLCDGKTTLQSRTLKIVASHRPSDGYMSDPRLCFIIEAFPCKPAKTLKDAVERVRNNRTILRVLEIQKYIFLSLKKKKKID